MNIFGTSDKDNLVGTAAADLIDGKEDKDQMAGGRGGDTYIVDHVDDKVIENANEGIDTVKSTVSYTLSANVENLTLMGSNNIDGTGNDLDNKLVGNDGNNTLNGGNGADSMNGGKGDDVYIVGHAGDKVIESIAGAAGGYDTVIASVDYSIASAVNVERLILSSGALKATGNSKDNTLIGNDQNNTLNGGAGKDVMEGGKGSDVYYVDNLGDVVVEKMDEGDDTIVSTVVFKNLVAHVENYIFNTNKSVEFTGTTADNWIRGGSGHDVIFGGGAGNDQLEGGAGVDQLFGGAGNDYLDGGKGIDYMQGGTGDDGYFIDNAADKVVESKNGGDDWVMSTISIAKLAENVESLYFAMGTGNLNATGNDLDNRIYGSGGNNVIDGGKGADQMWGMDGNDTYIVDHAGDKVTETSGGGTDLVKSSVSYVLTDHVENLTLTGTANIDGTGTKLSNILIGNDGNNRLDGGKGNDTMNGGKGNDEYIVDHLGDKVIESVAGAAGGEDTVYSSVDFSLAALANVEHLTLTGTTAVKATGNAKANHLTGNTADNIIDGGAGADQMWGGKGGDTYYMDNKDDVIGEFAGEGNDTVVTALVLQSAIDNVENYKFTGAKAQNFKGTDADNDIWGGSGGDYLHGGKGNDEIYGGAGNDALHGGLGNDIIDGGTGADTLYDEDGDDIYRVDNIGDIVLDQAGFDSVFATVSIGNLFQGIEHLQFEGTANLNGNGNDLDNYIIGNSGKNVLDGKNGNDTIQGSLGNDTMTGGAGKDKFVFDVSNAKEGKDVITDFAKADDILSLHNVGDRNADSKVNLADLLLTISSVVDHGAGKAVDVIFDSGAQITFNGAGTGSVDSIVDLVGTTAQIEVY
jgi:Ca2+-binding RTX toxin-like protein